MPSARGMLENEMDIAAEHKTLIVQWGRQRFKHHNSMRSVMKENKVREKEALRLRFDWKKKAA